MKKNKSSIMDKITDFTMKLAAPMGRFAELPCVAAIQNGLVAVMPLILIGSIFLIIGIMGTDAIGGRVLLPFLAPYASKITFVNDLTMNFLAFYCSITISMEYAQRLEADVKASALLGISTFLLFTIGEIQDGMISINSFSATGLFASIVSSLVAIKLYKFLVDRKITIKLPSSVPPSIGLAFTSLIPFAIILMLAWLIRSVIGFDLVEFFTNVLKPFVTAADNIWMWTANRGIAALFWGVGLHGDNMFNTPIFQPFQLMWTEENAAALASGISTMDLPHIWTYSGIDRLLVWPALVWPLVYLMIRSKVKYLKTLGWACLPAAIFGIVEPVVFGLPIALNPFLIIPFLLVAVVTAVLGYAFFALGFCAKFFAALPWATPPFILGPLGTGDLRSLIILVVVIIVGYLIYFPFWKQFERHMKEQEEANAAIEEQAE